LILVELLTIIAKTFFCFVDNKKKVLAVMVDNSTNINKPKECFDSDGRQFCQYQQTKRKFEQ
jgi:hypothetical protein